MKFKTLFRLLADVNNPDSMIDFGRHMGIGGQMANMAFFLKYDGSQVKAGSKVKRALESHQAGGRHPCFQVEARCAMHPPGQSKHYRMVA